MSRARKKVRREKSQIHGGFLDALSLKERKCAEDRVGASCEKWGARFTGAAGIGSGESGCGAACRRVFWRSAGWVAQRKGAGADCKVRERTDFCGCGTFV